MKVLVYNPLAAVWRPRLAAVLSVMQELIDDGHEVVHLGCERSVPACTANLDHARAICAYCIGRRNRGLRLLSGQFAERTLEEYLDAETLDRLWRSVDPIGSVDALRALKYRGADVGYAAFSSYAYVARKPVPDLGRPAVARVVQRLVNNGKIVYEAIARALEREQPGRLIVYHGRSAIDRAALRACQHAGIDCQVYETALGTNRLICFDNALPQDIGNFGSMIDRLWQSAPPDRAEVGGSFFEMRRRGTRSVQMNGAELRTRDRVYIDRQRAGRLPEDWDERRRNVVIYGTSNDEFIAISPEYEDRIYPSQAEALERLGDALASRKDIRLYFRIHPRQKAADEESARLEQIAAAHDNVVVIPADSDISSYALLDGAAVVLAFRSTMSMEAAYWGKPCILLSASIYRSLGATYNPGSHEEVLGLILTDGLPPKDRMPALKMGYFQMRSGFEHRYFTGDSTRGRAGYAFRGDPVVVDGLPRWRYLLSRERQRLKWRRLI